MVGNSLKSDILPVVSLGGWAVHIPSELTWEHEVAEIPADLRGRVFELEALARLAAWVRERSGPAASGGRRLAGSA
jgi:putative hydrolase of the HAD superfamily